jgi:hypothetical protein
MAYNYNLPMPDTLDPPAAPADPLQITSAPAAGAAASTPAPAVDADTSVLASLLAGMLG